MKLVILSIILMALAGCSTQMPDNVVIVGQDDNSTVDVVGQIESDLIDNDIGVQNSSVQNYSVAVVSIYDLNLSAFEQVDSYSYGSLTFVRDSSGLWITELFDSGLNTLFVLVLNYDPLSVQNISIQGDVTEFYQLMALYNASTFVTFDPFDTSEAVPVAYLEVSESLGEVGVSVVPAINQEAVNATLPVVDCNGQVPVIRLVNGGDAAVAYEDACLVISGTDADLVRAVDRFAWNFYGVMN